MVAYKMMTMAVILSESVSSAPSGRCQQQMGYEDYGKPADGLRGMWQTSITSNNSPSCRSYSRSSSEEVGSADGSAGADASVIRLRGNAAH